MKFIYILIFPLLFLLSQFLMVHSVFPALVKNHISKLGGQNLKIQVRAVGQFLLFPLEFVYDVRYIDAKGYEHETIVKPNSWRPLISEDKIVKRIKHTNNM